MIWFRFETITTEIKKTKCYQRNNCSMTECRIISRFLTGKAKELYSNECWKTLNHSYKDNKMFGIFQMWSCKIKSKCFTWWIDSPCNTYPPKVLCITLPKWDVTNTMNRQEINNNDHSVLTHDLTHSGIMGKYMYNTLICDPHKCQELCLLCCTTQWCLNPIAHKGRGGIHVLLPFLPVCHMYLT